MSTPTGSDVYEAARRQASRQRLGGLIVTRFAAVRARVQRDTDKDLMEEYYDFSTLTDTAGGALLLADAADARNHAAIRKGTALPHVRIARLRIEEVR